jgi:glyoxalase family protein
VTTSGIHHVTIICGPAQRNVDFYTRVLGQRLVKKTVNFDDSATYHFYYGDCVGRPGTIITFFPWEDRPPGRSGTGQALETTYRVPMEAMAFWQRRFIEMGVAFEPLTRRFGDPFLAFKDPDGVHLGLVGVEGAAEEPGFAGDDVPGECALRGFHGVTLMEKEVAPTQEILVDVLGLRLAAHEGPLTRFRAGDTAIGGIVDVYAVGDSPKGRIGAGAIHHVAFRASDDAAQMAMGKLLTEIHHIPVTEQKNRKYFRSTYFSEPGGVRLELATDDPGFTADETEAELGGGLKLPNFLEPRRTQIEAALPALV